MQEGRFAQMGQNCGLNAVNLCTMSQTRTVTLGLPSDLLDRFEAVAKANGISLTNAMEAAMRQTLGGSNRSIQTTNQDPGAREALKKLKERTKALEALTQQMMTHMRMLQEDVDTLKKPERQSPQELIAELLPPHGDDFAAGF